MSAAALVADLLAAGVVVEAEGDRVRLRSPRAGLLRPEHVAAVRELKPALLLMGSGQWREQLAGWPAWWRGRWAELAEVRQGEGLARERAEQLAFFEAAELPDGEAPAGPAAAGQLAGQSELPSALWPAPEPDESAPSPLDAELDAAPSREPLGGWIVHPQACGGCGAKGLADRGLGACVRCGWRKPERERFALAYRLATDEGLARRLEGEG